MRIDASPKTVLLALVALATIFGLLPPWVVTDAVAGAPTDRLRAQIDEVYRVFRAAPPTDRHTAVRKVIDDMFDWAEMAQRSLGSHWLDRTPEERTEFVELFADLFEHAYVSQIGLADAERFRYSGDTVEGDHVIVRTTVVTKRGSEIPVEYLTHADRTRSRVYDLQIEGISLVGNYGRQFNAIIVRSSYRALVEKLQDMAKKR